MERKFNNMFTIHTQHTITHLSIQPQKKKLHLFYFSLLIRHGDGTIHRRRRSIKVMMA